MSVETDRVFLIDDVRIVMFIQDGALVCHLHPAEGETYQHFGLMICDLIRHVANAFFVSEKDVFGWVQKEYLHPTTTLTRPS